MNEPRGEVGIRLRMQRARLGISQAELGRQLGVNQYLIFKWEMGMVKPQARNMKRIEHFLSLDLTAIRALKNLVFKKKEVGKR